MIKEVEIKVRLSLEQKDEVINRLNNIYNLNPLNSREEDTYYTSKYKDFIKSRECLRIRKDNSSCVLTWKPPTDKTMSKSSQFWKEELDIIIGDQVDKIKLLLQKLDFIEYVVVDKERLIFEIDLQTKILIDHIIGVGFFMEIETISEDIDDARYRNIEILNSFGIPIENIEVRPYRDIVKLRIK